MRDRKLILRAHGWTMEAHTMALAVLTLSSRAKNRPSHYTWPKCYSAPMTGLWTGNIWR